jgi:putative phosphoesterase
MRIAVLADIHSNLPALEAVQADLLLAAPDMVLLAGDQINRCPWPNEVMDLIDAEGWPAIMGNHELMVKILGTSEAPASFKNQERFADLWWTKAALTPEHMAQVHALPTERKIENAGGATILMLHGMKDNPFEGFTTDMSDDQIVAKLEGIDETVVLSAHTHAPLARVVAGRQLFNPGSVGMPYNGDPRAQYLLLDLAGNGILWQPTFRQVEYDRSLVREAFDRLGLFHAYGPLGPLYWQTIATAHPFVSDFQIWLREQPKSYIDDLEQAVSLYLEAHGPGNWAYIAG